uniref:Uncharacterized protein n=1 Tax=Arundo donax TaxID=35708 RepID=A0A0A9C125_ARUDO
MVSCGATVTSLDGHVANVTRIQRHALILVALCYILWHIVFFVTIS